MKILLAVIAVLVGAFVQAQDILASTEFEVENATEIRIKGKFCDVVVEKGDKTYFKGVIEGKGDPDDYEIRSNMEGSVLMIEVFKSDRTWTNLSKSELRLTVNDDLPVMVRNSSGDIYVNGIGGKEYAFQATSGDIDIRKVRADLMVGATSGDIDIDGVEGELNVESTSGDIEIDGADGSIECRSTSGDIDISNFSGDLTVQATSGDINMSSGVGMIRAKTTSGEIDGDGIELKGNAELKASSGDIEISFANDMSELSFDLETNSGSLRAAGRSSDKTLYLKEGNIWVKGITTSGNQRFN